MTSKQRRSRERAREHAAKKRAVAQTRWDEAHGKTKPVDDKPFIEPPGGIIIIDDYVRDPMVIFADLDEHLKRSIREQLTYMSSRLLPWGPAPAGFSIEDLTGERIQRIRGYHGFCKRRKEQGTT